jgi:medium-chain acyl-[acyl-carrier-protein] hydrolase
LFCFPYAGGGIAAFRTWPNHLPADVEVCSIQLPGRDDRMKEKPYSDLTSLVEALAEGLSPNLAAPYAFFGHSMGALITFELVRQLRRRGMILPLHLFVSARRAPHLPSREPPCHQLPEHEFVQTLVQRYNGIPQAILAEPELMQLFIPILRADFTLMETYRFVPEQLLEQNVTIFGGTDDQIVSRDDLSGWKELTRGTTDFHLMPGGHFFLQTGQAGLVGLIGKQIMDGMQGAR